ncbi:MAG: c-type cytochrome domain-containing protein [Planctomycetota bacterium]|jgi:hypothetical protein
MRCGILTLLVVTAACFDVDPTGELIQIGDGDGGGNGNGGGTTVSFALDIQPLFNQDCILCHGGAGGLSLESYAGVIAGGSSGAIVIPGNPAQSLLPRRLDGTVPPQMPLNAPPLTTPEIDRIRQWILEGALNN